MTRRTFCAAIPCVGAFANPGVALDAVVAPVLPSRLLLPGTIVAGLPFETGILEHRTYRDPSMNAILRKAGLQFMDWGDSLLVHVPSFEVRAQTWTDISAKVHRQDAAYEFSVYRWS